ncbi:hypothetical protein AB2T90_17195 [Clostridium butyricum]|uniref:hypothetical protein n=1 Tax=Clostridium butyricum TaxID=1492 RepID=UPI003466D1E0
MREKRDYQEKIFDKEFMYIKLGTDLDIVTDNVNRTLQKIRDIMLYNYNFEYGRKDNSPIFHGVISDNNGRESNIRFFERGKIDENCNIGENAEILIDCEDNKTNKYDFVKQSIDKLMQEFLSIEPSEKNTMRRKDILGMIEKLNDMGDKECPEFITNLYKLYKNGHLKNFSYGAVDKDYESKVKTYDKNENSLYEMNNMAQKEDFLNNICIQEVAEYNKGYFKINDVEIPEIQNLRIFIKNINGALKGFINVKSIVLGSKIEKEILSQNSVMNISCKYSDAKTNINIYDVKLLENKEIDIFNLDCETSKVVSHEFYFTFDINNLVIE